MELGEIMATRAFSGTSSSSASASRDMSPCASRLTKTIRSPQKQGLASPARPSGAIADERLWYCSSFSGMTLPSASTKL